MPMVPLAPGRLRTTKGWPSRSVQFLRDGARDDIGRAAGAVGDDDLDVAGGVGSGLGAGGDSDRGQGRE